MVKTETSLKVKCLRSDNGGEYIDEGFNEYCAAVRDRAPGPLLLDVGPNPHEWVESCYYLSKWRFD